MPPQNPQVQNTPQAPPLGNTAQRPPGVPIMPPLPKKKFPKIVIWIGALLAGLLLIFLAYKLIFGRKTKDVTLTWWGLWEDQAVVSPLISEFELANPGVKISYVKQSPQDYRERLTNAMAKGTGPDIFRFHNTWVPMFRNDLDTLPSAVINPSDYAKTFYPIVSSDLTNGSGIVGIPLGYDALTLYINEDIFDKAGKTPPKTWNELRELAKQLTVIDDKGTITQSGVALGRTENVDHWQEILALLMLQNGVDLSNPTGEQAGDALIYFTLFSTEDGVWDVTLPSSTQAFAAGKLAMYLAPSWRSFEISLANPNLKYKTVPVPQLPKDDPNQPDITYATYWSEGVWSKSPNKAKAWEFLKFLSTKESLQKLYQNETKTRLFGEPYSRMEMADLLKTHPVVGSIISLAPGAQSWYLASRTFDGPTGINSQLSNYFGDALNSVIEGNNRIEKILETLSQGVTQVLSQYRLTAR